MGPIKTPWGKLDAGHGTDRARRPLVHVSQYYGYSPQYMVAGLQHFRLHTGLLLLSDLGEQNMHSMSLFYYLLMFLHVMKLFFFFAFSYSVFAETFSCWNSSWLACFAPAITANSCLSQKPLFHCIATLANRTFRTIPSTRNNHNYGVMLATVISCEQLRKWRSEYRFFFSLMAPL